MPSAVFLGPTSATHLPEVTRPAKEAGPQGPVDLLQSLWLPWAGATLRGGDSRPSFTCQERQGWGEGRPT